MSILMVLGLLYLAVLVAIILHEIGHCPRKIRIIKWFPLPEGASYDSRSRYGGLASTFLIAYLVFRFKPETLFLQWMGLAAWVHFILYGIFGSINKEYKIPKQFYKYFIFDDIENKYWWFFIPLAIAVFYYFKGYYIPVVISIFQTLI